MKSIILTCFAIILSLSSVSAQEMVKGKVYLDSNKNNKMDQREKGIADVAVSNGKDVVLTDKDGKYEIPVDNDEIIFVIKPSEYNLPVNDKNLPQFYYIHKPAGSPELKYKGVEPTGPLPEEVNFALWEGEYKEDYDILVFGDPQPYTEKEVDYFDRDIVNELEGVQGYEFGLSLGDIVGDDLDLYTPYINSVARIGIPWFNVYGNHDMNYDVEDGEYADETWEATYGPATYSFNHGKVHYINLDDVIYPREDGRGGYVGGFTEKQLAFIENDLAVVPKDRLVIVSFHIPTIYEGVNPATFREADQKRLFELLLPFENTLTLSAHTHMQGIFFIDDTFGWNGQHPHFHYNVGTTSGDWWSGTPDRDNIPETTMRDGTPNGYAMLRFKGNQFTIDYKVARQEASVKMNIWGPKVVPRAEWFSTEFYVNYFLGNDSTIVEYKLKDSEDDWRKMSRVKMGDPFITDLRSSWDKSEILPAGKRPSNPEVSTHLWKTGVPKGMPQGEYTMQFRVTDLWGRQFFGEHSYRIEER